MRRGAVGKIRGGKSDKEGERLAPGNKDEEGAVGKIRRGPIIKIRRGPIIKMRREAVGKILGGNLLRKWRSWHPVIKMMRRHQVIKIIGGDLVRT